MQENTPLERITEGFTTIWANVNKSQIRGPGAKGNLPFYNNSMELNRDISVALCQWMVQNSNRKLSFLDGLAATGIRGLRLANEIKGDFSVYINDWNSESYSLIKRNILELKLEKCIALNSNLNKVLSNERYDYIDIDPFGSPVYFIDSAMRSINNNGIIACTATDTATLCGRHQKVCFRRYTAHSLNTIPMKEIGLRIILGVICRTAGIYEKGIIPLLTYASDHYFRIYVKVINGAKKSDQSMNNLKLIDSEKIFPFNIKGKAIGPMWNCKLQDKRFIQELREIVLNKKLGKRTEIWKLFDFLEDEANGPMFFFSTDGISSILKRSPPKIFDVIEHLKKNGYFASRTHFNPMGFKTDAPQDEIEKLFK
jgi:tRNA (guanine26-N2/guanine27-N2)-dimethyltransferase